MIFMWFLLLLCYSDSQAASSVEGVVKELSSLSHCEQHPKSPSDLKIESGGYAGIGVAGENTLDRTRPQRLLLAHW